MNWKNFSFNILKSLSKLGASAGEGGKSHLLKSCHVISKSVLIASMQETCHYLQLPGEKTEAQKSINLVKIRDQERDGS